MHPANHSQNFFWQLGYDANPSDICPIIKPRSARDMWAVGNRYAKLERKKAAYAKLSEILK